MSSLIVSHDSHLMMLEIAVENASESFFVFECNFRYIIYNISHIDMYVET